MDEVILRGAVNFIDDRIKYGGVLVHCWAGVNRSASVAVAYLMMKTQMSLVDAVRAAMNTRGTVLTNYSFRLLLVQASLPRSSSALLADPSHGAQDPNILAHISTK